jgi:lipopolysaccharide heptosyltransferase II
VKRLVVVAPNWLGDAVMALPAIADVRRGAPGAVIDVAARPAVAPLFTLVDGVGDVVVLEHRSSVTRDFAADFAGRSYDAALLLPNSFQSALTVWRAAIPLRWGFRTDLRAPLLTSAIARPGRGHQAAYYQHLTRELGFQSGALEPRIEIPAALRQAGADLLKGAGWDGTRPLMAVAPGAAYGGAKRWPADSFAAVADGLAADGVAAVLVGSAGDRAAADEVLAATRSAPLDLVGRTDLRALGGVLSNCRGLVSNDSGAMHFAAAIGLAVTAMFGPTEEWATRPLGRKPPVVLIHDVWCRPCMLRECPIDHRCMREITADSVLAAARQAM